MSVDRLQRRSQAGLALSQQPQRPVDAAAKLRQFLNLGAVELIRMERLADLRDFPSAEAARKFVHRHDVPFKKVGRRVEVDLRDFDRVCDDLAARKAS